MVGVDAGYLADAYVLLGDVELLVVGAEELLGALAVGAARGVELAAYVARGSTPAMRARRSAMAMSRLVQVGDLNMTVSESMAPAMSPAIFGEGIMPRS